MSGDFALRVVALAGRRIELVWRGYGFVGCKQFVMIFD
jgi:hypothetical protein